MFPSPELSKDFLIFSFYLEHIVAELLLQKNHEGNEQTISFYRKTLRDAPLKYNILDKQAYALVRALKEFKVYILHSHIIAHIPTSIVKDILTQPDPNGQRGNWIEYLLDFDLYIKSTNLIKGQGLAKLMAQYNCDSLNLHMIVELSAEEKNPHGQLGPPIADHFLSSPWYTNIIFVLQHLQAPQGMENTRSIFLKKKASRFCILEGKLYWKEP